MIIKLNWMNRLLLLIFSFFLISGCSQGKDHNKNSGDGNVAVSGTVKNPQDGVVLFQELQNNEMVTIDTVQLDDKNAFDFTVAVSEPGFYRLNLYDNQYVNFILNDEDVKITADGQSSDGVAEVKGSKDTDHFYSVNAIMQDFQEEVQELEVTFQQASMEGDEEKVESLRKAYVALDEKKSDKVKEAIDNMGNSLAALYAVNFLDPEKDFPFLDKLAQKVDQGMPNSKYAQEFVASVNGMRTLAIGEMAPDIALPNPDGDVVALSSLRGKYVLIDFWAAWCRPCRIENPNVVRMYHKYNEKGFEVFGVSLDRNKKDWVEAIEADGLVWTQVSDLQYFNSAAASLYNIQAIPATYLIDPDGKIIAKNLRGAALEEKLAEVLL